MSEIIPVVRLTARVAGVPRAGDMVRKGSLVMGFPSGRVDDRHHTAARIDRLGDAAVVVAGDHDEVTVRAYPGDDPDVAGRAASAAREHHDGADAGLGDPVPALGLITGEARRGGPEPGFASHEVDEVAAPQRARQVQVAGRLAFVPAGERDEIERATRGAGDSTMGRCDAGIDPRVLLGDGDRETADEDECGRSRRRDPTWQRTRPGSNGQWMSFVQR